MNPQTPYRNFYAMGTRLDIVIPGQPGDVIDDVSRKIKAEASRLENMLSIYKEDSSFSEINRRAYHSAVKINDELFNLLLKLLEYHKLTEGYFDITLGKIKNRDSRSDHPIQVSSLGMDKLIFDQEEQTLGFQNESLMLDPGAFGKGLLLENIKKLFGKYKIHSAFISFGESSVLAFGTHPHGDHWKVGIQDLFRPGMNAYVFNINNASVSTSGNNQQNLRKFEEGHLINPFSGERQTEYIQLCIASESALEAEVLSTALFFAKKDEVRTILSKFDVQDAVKIVYAQQGAEPEIIKLLA